MTANIKDGDPETYAVIGAAMEVHRELHHGFVEPIYQDAFAVELNLRRIPFERERPLQVFYNGGILPSTYKADFVCFGTLLVECNALPAIGHLEEGQVLNYLRITRLMRAVLLNFGTRSFTYKRLILTHANSDPESDQSAGNVSL
jgi:GxxExxY protein